METQEEYTPLYDRPVDPDIDVPQEEVEDLKKKRVADHMVIDHSNFAEYFHDVRWSQPKDGQVMARFRGRAEFIDGQLKRDVVNLLLQTDRGGDVANKVMRKLACATERDAVSVPLQMAVDLASGLSVDQVCEKVYAYDIEAFYYADPENVPEDDRHWDVIRLIGRPGDQKWEITSNIQEKIEELCAKYESESSSKEDHESSRGFRDLGEEVGRSPGEVEGGGPAGTASAAEE